MINPIPATWRSPLKRGMSGADVEAWQQVLISQRFLVPPMDGDFGPKTEKATIQFQITHRLPADGDVGPLTRRMIDAIPVEPTPIPGVFDRRWAYLQAANFNRMPPNNRRVSLIVMHTMQSPNRPDTAEGVASWFAGKRPGGAPKASAHVCVDVDSIVQCVLPKDIAWGAQGGNWCSYHIEQAAYAEWTLDEWSTPEATSMLKLAGSHVRLAGEYFGLDTVALTTDEVAGCIRDAMIFQSKLRGSLSNVKGGVCTHRQITDVWQGWAKYGLPNPRLQGWWPDHVDCGPHYPMVGLLGFAK